MGSRTDDKLKEIEQLRASLGAKLDLIEKRFPVAGMGKKVAGALAGSSVAGTALTFGLRRLRGGRRGGRTEKRGKRRRGTEQIVPTTVTVNLLPKGAAWIAAVGLAGWAGVKVYEAVKRSKEGAPPDRFRPSVVTPMTETGRGSGT